MEKKIYPSKSAKWDFYHNVVVARPGCKLEGFPFATKFPKDYAHGQRYQIILVDSTIEAAIVDFSGDEFFWRRIDGPDVTKEHVAAWCRIERSEISDAIPDNPRVFYEGLKMESKNVETLVKELYYKMKSCVSMFESYADSLLFCDDTLCVDVRNPWGTYNICGIKIFAVPWCNCSYSTRVECIVKFRIVFLTKNDSTSKKPYFGINPTFYWIGENIIDVFSDDAFGELQNLRVEHNGKNEYRLEIAHHRQFEELRSLLSSVKKSLGL